MKKTLLKRWSLVVLSATLLIWCGYGVDFNLINLKDIGNTYHFIVNRWFPLDLSILTLAVKSTIITLQMAVLGTFLGLLIAFPLSYLAAWNTTPSIWVYRPIKAILNFFRSVPEIVLGLILVPTFGLGPFPAVLAIAIHNIGILGKLIAESIESSDKGQQEALKSVGANNFIVSMYGIVPQISPSILSDYFYRVECGVRSSLVLGFIGAGGIGNMLFIDFKTGNYGMVATEVIMIMMLVTFIDYISSLTRKSVVKC